MDKTRIPGKVKIMIDVNTTIEKINEVKSLVKIRDKDVYTYSIHSSMVIYILDT